MNKAEFVAAIAAHTGLSKKDTDTFLQGFRKALEESLPEAGRIALPGIGVFEVSERAARKGRNPATGAEIDIPAKKTVKFKAAKELIEHVQ